MKKNYDQLSLKKSSLIKLQRVKGHIGSIAHSLHSPERLSPKKSEQAMALSSTFQSLLEPLGS